MEERINKIEELIGKNNREIAEKIIGLEKTLGVAAKTIEHLAKSSMKLADDVKNQERKINELNQFAEQVVRTNQQMASMIAKLAENSRPHHDTN
ncbi:MAG: hypothetical protein A2W91_13885 [Bacteroidetes bacterium GWF2_38_335]|nr:MAG: hypothetical protein A2W91_13885 [Bacteroidetes bacterium GWF2_38_335]OFY77806.1 MAG: hypothetical protein A2281_15575 [Bacteroidetes bacterium RIFOXYA12_FULL_38_20]HBS87388.1 hypothetical protein [Bacteroidales bacterium]